MPKEKQILLAFFDILGTSEMLNNGDYQAVYDYYTFMANLCSDTHTPIAIVNRMYGLNTLGLDFSNEKYLIINYDLNHCFFSDTFLLWIEFDSFHQPTLAGFLENCCIVFCEAIKRGIPLRGAISSGTAIMDKTNNIYLGKPLAEAAKAETQQNWLGIGLGKSIQNILPMDMKYVLPYFKHIKTKGNNSLGGWVLDWPSWWRETEKTNVIPLINKMNTDTKYESYYNNCISFVEVSKQGDNVWNIFMIFQDMHRLSELCEMGDNITKELRIIRQQDIEVLTSYRVLDYIQYILEQSNNDWLSENDKDILKNILNGFILVNGKLEAIDNYRE